MSWKMQAACADRGDVDWDSFGPPQILICSSCPVRADCLHEGMLQPDACGTWGMTSEAQRNRVRGGKSSVADVWAENVAAAAEWLEERERGPVDV